MSHRRALLLGLMLLFFALTTFSARRTSLTTDEILHIESGYACLATGDYRLVEEHPPLTKMWEALPLLTLDPPLPDPRTLPGWDEADLLPVAQAAIPPHKPLEPLVFAARVPVMLLGVLLLAFVWRWAATLWGERGALLAVALAALDPNLLAHAAVAATDLGATLGLFAATFFFRRWLHRPARGRALAMGAALGLALGTKSTALILPPLFAFLLLVARPPRRPLTEWLRTLLPAVGMAFLTLWALYRFTFGTLPGVVAFPVPMPDALRPLLRLREHVGDLHAAFLLGEKYDGGRWAYFPVAFLLKTPPLTLGLLGLTAGGLALRRLRSVGRRQEVELLALPLLYFAVSVAGDINIGYRHLLPILPFLFVWVGRWGEVLRGLPAMALRLAWGGYALVALLLAPWHLSYFNLLAGGTENGWRYLSDANTDWGQGYKALADFEREHGLDSVRLAAFITYDPALTYGVAFEPLTPYGGFTPPVFPQRFAPPPGEYVISTTPLDGIPLADPEMYDWFRWREPDAVIAHALHDYHVTAEETAVTWVAECLSPTVPLDGAAVAFGFGEGKRILTFDCTRGWVVPPGAGAYVLHGAWVEDSLQARLHYAEPPVRDPFVAARLAEGGTRLIYRQRRTGATPPFVIYRRVEPPAPPPAVAFPAEAGSPPASLTTSAPCRVGPLRLVGASVGRGAEALEVLVWWEVVSPPPSPDLSLMGHLVAPDGRALAVDDGLAFLPEMWRAGDRFAQRFRFPAAEGELWLRTGLYRLGTMERFPVEGVEGADACFIPLGE